MLDMNHPSASDQAMQDLWSKVCLKYFPSRSAKAPLTLKSFGGIEKRRVETMVTIMMYDNPQLVKHLEVTLNKQRVPAPSVIE
jgi:hypothetical protein